MTTDSTSTSADPPIITADALTLAFGPRLRALDGLTLSVQRGCTGLLGPNGAGKSTLIKVLLGLLKPDSGRATVLGKDVAVDRQEVRRRVGYMPERDCHIHGMVALSYVSLMGELSGLDRTTAIKRAHEVLNYVDLGEARYRPVDGFSAGMRQRMKLAAAIVHDPDFLLLDEPTNGLDPSGRRFMLDLVAKLEECGISILISTHLLPDVQETCQRIVVVAGGRVVNEGSVADLTRGLARTYTLRLMGPGGDFVRALADRGIDATVDPTSGDLRVRLPEGKSTRDLFEASRAAAAGLKHLQPGTRSLEEVFLESIEGGPRAHP